MDTSLDSDCVLNFSVVLLELLRSPPVLYIVERADRFDAWNSDYFWADLRVPSDTVSDTGSATYVCEVEEVSDSTVFLAGESVVTLAPRCMVGLNNSEAIQAYLELLVHSGPRLTLGDDVFARLHEHRELVDLAAPPVQAEVVSPPGSLSSLPSLLTPPSSSDFTRRYCPPPWC